MPGPAEICFAMLSLLHLAWARVLYNHNEVFLGDRPAASFLSRSLLYNSWDFEMVRADNLERECIEEICNFEEAREVFEDETQALEKWWRAYVNSHESTPRVDVSGLVAGIFAILVTAVIVVVLGLYFYKSKKSGGRRSASAPVRLAMDGRPAPESVPLNQIAAPGLPSYNEAVNRSGVHDAPPPPYSGGAPSEPPDPADLAEEE